ncbi:cation diffusion facilitator family transporter [Thermoflavifilum thermophilum]|uniref:Cobalt-zinc-cadmium efflux system protein n=1 Tax=Thermoflavifilum thermophilum TaxID=1393122 RepID=A0A1I7N873_9BACT|nr:cation diffusion facilitator family transporter [Thermoflavifilum thermophilum]SFV30766.1 cobalt-zinc-cadmium efflux system protein [Thermoflavifilum thermophilum]
MHVHHSHISHPHKPAGLHDSFRRVLWLGVMLNTAYVLVEAFVGLWLHSLSLVADAGHNLMDVLSLVISLLAFRLLQISPNQQFTYGYRKTTILAALLNAVILLITVGAIGMEAVKRMLHPLAIAGIDVSIVAGCGILINGFTAFLFFRYQHRDLNMKGAFLHMLADALVSVAVVISGLLMAAFGWYWLDPVISFAVLAVILISTWNLLKESLRLSLDGVPRDVDVQALTRRMEQVKGVKNVHHVHVWAMSTLENALTAHVVVDQQLSVAESSRIRHELEAVIRDMHIQHSTFEMETPADACKHGDCCVAAQQTSSSPASP